MAKVIRKKRGDGFDYSSLPPEAARRLKELAAEIRLAMNREKRAFAEQVPLVTRKGAKL